MIGQQILKNVLFGFFEASPGLKFPAFGFKTRNKCYRQPKSPKDFSLNVKAKRFEIKEIFTLCKFSQTVRTNVVACFSVKQLWVGDKRQRKRISLKIKELKK